VQELLAGWAASSGNAAILPLVPVMFYQLFVLCVLFLLVCCTTIMSVASRRRFVKHVLRFLASKRVWLAINWTSGTEVKRDRAKRTSQDTLKENVQAAGITGT